MRRMSRASASIACLLLASTSLAQSPAPTVGSTGSGTTSVVGAVAERVPPQASANDPVVRLGVAPPPKLDGAVTLRELFKVIRDASGVHVQGLWTGQVPGTGLDPEATVRVEVPVGNCADLLDAALDLAAGSGEPMAWQATKFGVEAGPLSALWRPSALKVRVYDVSDLLLRAPNFRSTGIPQPSGGNASGGGAGGAGGGSGGTSGGGAGGAGNGGGGGSGAGSSNADDPEVHRRKAVRRDELAGLIERNVVPQAWQANGGPCTITPHDATLIIRAPEFVHRLIESPIVERRRPDSLPQRVGKPSSAP